MYAKGDYIHHARDGLCKVEDVTYLDVAGVDKDKLYYKLSPVTTENCTVFIPVENSAENTRYIMTKNEAMALIAEIPSIKTLRITEERKREQRYKEALFSTDSRNWVKIIKTLYLRNLDRSARGQKISSTDERYLRKAENCLYGELALALGMEKENMEDYIIEQLKGKQE